MVKTAISVFYDYDFYLIFMRVFYRPIITTGKVFKPLI